MGLQLREALRRICVEIGWSYAVFWRAIRCRDQMHLVWEDGYCERASIAPGISGFEAMDLLLKERVGLRSSHDNLFAELGHGTEEDKMGSLVFKTMASQIHFVGDGIVGQAALTGNHQWILRDSLVDYGSVPKGLAEMNHQFLAGIQTITIVPVLPHGVLQLGSTQMVMENVGFINHIKSLFTQLGCVPSVLISDVTQKYLSQNIQEIPASLNQFGDSGSNISRFSSLADDCNHHHPKVLDKRSVISPSCSSSPHMYGKMTANASKVPLIMQTVAPTMMPFTDFSQPTSLPVVEPILHQRSQLISGAVGTQVVFSNPDAWSIENATPHDSSSESQHQSLILTGFSSNSLLLEEQLISMSGSQESANKRDPKLDNSGTLQVRSRGCKFSNSPTGSHTVSQFGLSKTLNDVNALGRRSLLPGGATRSCGNSCLVSSSMEVHQMLDSTEHSNSIKMLSGKSQLKCPTSIQKSETVPSEGQQGKENNLFEDLDIASTEFDEQHSCYGSVLGTQDGLLTNLNTIQENSTNNSAVCAENITWAAPNRQNIVENDKSTSLQALNKRTSIGPVRPTSGNDLFDLLGLNYKSGGFLGGMDDATVNGNDANAHKLSVDASACTTQLDMGPVYDALNDENCCGSLFSEASPDQLLDAVVAQINSGAKQNLDDNVSCKTSLTRISSSSLHTSSPTYGWVASSEQMPGKLNRKRTRPGENPRPRPKDRQMIQDRVKELREIVPNGAKCSIDALLEKTIKHMLFLQSVTKHADKLKEVGESKIMSKEGSILLKDNFEGGATWAFEVGTQSMICPIIVEDLNPPRQMLVEMLCEERGLFLEIADLIKGLGLTILKGVMEARSDKVWARFAVEANRDITRMEVFLSLVRLLEPNAGTRMAPQGAENLSMQHNMFHPSSIPATGQSDRLR